MFSSTKTPTSQALPSNHSSDTESTDGGVKLAQREAETPAVLDQVAFTTAPTAAADHLDAPSRAAPAPAPAPPGEDKGKGRALDEDEVVQDDVDQAKEEDWEIGLTKAEISERINLKIKVEAHRHKEAMLAAKLARGEYVDVPNDNDPAWVRAGQQAFEDQIAIDEANYEKWGLARKSIMGKQAMTKKQAKNEKKKQERKEKKALRK